MSREMPKEYKNAIHEAWMANDFTKQLIAQLEDDMKAATSNAVSTLLSGDSHGATKWAAISVAAGNAIDFIKNGCGLC